MFTAVLQRGSKCYYKPNSESFKSKVRIAGSIILLLSLYSQLTEKKEVLF